jgi:hypothetical protein
MHSKINLTTLNYQVENLLPEISRVVLFVFYFDHIVVILSYFTTLYRTIHFKSAG